MKLVDDIIEMASDSKRPLADVLRRCLILAFELKNEKLKEWVEKELNGYGTDDEIPGYRTAALHSRGTFSGPFGARVENQPLPVLGVLEPEHLELLAVKLRQPIGAYESGMGADSNPRIPWNPDLTALYQSSFLKGYTLVSAWQVVPRPLLVGLYEEVRNRLLRFALEIKSELGDVGDKPSKLPTQKVESAVTNYIYGGTNVIAGTASQFTQVGTVIAGDFESLVKRLKGLNVTEVQIDELIGAIKADKQGFGERTKAWMKKVGEATMGAGGKMGVEILKEALLQYFDLK